VIPQHLQRLQVCQAVLPHLRMGQLIVNAMQERHGRRTNAADTVQRMFYAEDEELVRIVESYAFNRDQL
jgi:hypothetical protein